MRFIQLTLSAFALCLSTLTLASNAVDVQLQGKEAARLSQRLVDLGAQVDCTHGVCHIEVAPLRCNAMNEYDFNGHLKANKT